MANSEDNISKINMVLYKSLQQSVDMSRRVYNLSAFEKLNLDKSVGKKLKE